MWEVALLSSPCGMFGEYGKFKSLKLVRNWSCSTLLFFKRTFCWSMMIDIARQDDDTKQSRQAMWGYEIRQSSPCLAPSSFYLNTGKQKRKYLSFQHNNQSLLQKKLSFTILLHDVVVDGLTQITWYCAWDTKVQSLWCIYLWWVLPTLDPSYLCKERYLGTWKDMWIVYVVQYNWLSMFESTKFVKAHHALLLLHSIWTQVSKRGNIYHSSTTINHCCRRNCRSQSCCMMLSLMASHK